MRARIVFYSSAVLVLVASVTFAQKPAKQSTTPEPAARETGSGMATGRRSVSAVPANDQSVSAREAQSGMASGRKSGSVVAADFNAAEAASPRDAQTGMATGKRQHEPILLEQSGEADLNARNSGHATETLRKHAGVMSDVQSNPMYKDNGNQGTNPLYEQKDRTAAPPSGGAAAPAAYKDGEDGVSHTRPGNHKPGRMN